jgi:hypothetical protein
MIGPMQTDAMKKKGPSSTPRKKVKNNVTHDKPAYVMGCGPMKCGLPAFQ